MWFDLMCFFSGLINWAFYGGSRKESLSGRCWREWVENTNDAERQKWRARQVKIDEFFSPFAGANHCYNVYKKEQARKGK